MSSTSCFSLKSSYLSYALIVSGCCGLAYTPAHAEDETATKKREPGIYAGMKDGLRIQTHDKRYVFKFGGRLQIDSHTYAYPSEGWWNAREPRNHVFDVRRARMELNVTLSEYYQGKLTADFANKVELDDAYINLRYFPAMEIRIGQFGYPFGVESLISSKYDTFAESSTIGSAVSSGRDRGLMLQGSTKNDQYAYQLAVMNGVPQNTDDNNDDLDLAIRLVRNPEEVVEGEWNLWYGLSYSQGGQLVGKDKAFTLRTESKSGRNFLKAPLAEGTQYTRQRVAVNFATVKGPVMLSTEYYSAAYDFTANVQVQGYYVIASYFLTGEQRNIKDGLLERIPIKQAYDPAGPGIGAWELALRYSVFYADRKFFKPEGLYPGWEPLDPAKNVNAGYTWTLGINWYPDTMVGIQLDWIQTYVAKEPARNLGDARSVKSARSETALLLRTQLDF